MGGRGVGGGGVQRLQRVVDGKGGLTVQFRSDSAHILFPISSFLGQHIFQYILPFHGIFATKIVACIACSKMLHDKPSSDSHTCFQHGLVFHWIPLWVLRTQKFSSFVCVFKTQGSLRESF